MSEAKRIADREDEIADAHDCRVAYRHFHEVISLNLDQCDVCGRVRADDLGVQNCTVDQRDLDCICVFDDMMIGQNIAARRIDNDAGSCTGNFARTSRRVRKVEKPAKCIVAKW